MNVEEYLKQKGMTPKPILCGKCRGFHKTEDCTADVPKRVCHFCSGDHPTSQCDKDDFAGGDSNTGSH